MQTFICPFCGPRNETEFHFVTEAGHDRPEPAASVSDADWAAYVHMNKSPKGEASEIWVHLTCAEYFTLTRDSVTREILRAEPLPEAPR